MWSTGLLQVLGQGCLHSSHSSIFKASRTASHLPIPNCFLLPIVTSPRVSLLERPGETIWTHQSILPDLHHIFKIPFAILKEHPQVHALEPGCAWRSFFSWPHCFWFVLMLQLFQSWPVGSPLSTSFCPFDITPLFDVFACLFIGDLCYFLVPEAIAASFWTLCLLTILESALSPRSLDAFCWKEYFKSSRPWFTITEVSSPKRPFLQMELSNRHSFIPLCLIQFQ